MLGVVQGSYDQSVTGTIKATGTTPGQKNVAVFGNDYTVKTTVVLAPATSLSGGGVAARQTGLDSYIGIVFETGSAFFALLGLNQSGVMHTLPGHSPVPIPPASSYQIELSIQGQTLSLKVNGVVVDSGMDATFASGPAGLFDISGVSTFTGLAITP